MDDKQKNGQNGNYHCNRQKLYMQYIYLYLVIFIQKKKNKIKQIFFKKCYMRGIK